MGQQIVTLIVGLSWPVIVFFALIAFRGDLKALLDRVESASKEGLQFGFPQTAPKGEPNSTQPLSPPASSQMPVAGQPVQKLAARDFITPIYLSFYDAQVGIIKASLPNVEARVAGSREEILMALSAEASAVAYLERSTRRIFGSQLDALESLGGQNAPLTPSMFRPFYDRAVTAFPTIYANYSFDQWLGFLKAVGLVRDLPDGGLSLTEAGRVTPRYMADQGYQRPIG